MFCPRCGRDNSHERKFCASCGTNLEVVSQALTENTDSFLTKTENALDQFLARYAEHVFKSAPTNLSDRRVSKSWQVLGQAVATSFFDMILFSLMWNILPLRFLILLVSTPIRLVSERGRSKAPAAPSQAPLKLPESRTIDWAQDPAPSVSEHTTVNLQEQLQRPPGSKVGQSNS